MPTMRTVLALLLCFAISTACFAVELVKEGRPLAEIVLAENPLPQVRFAAQELQEHIEKISGAKLAIVTAPSAGMKSIFVGESAHTKKLGLTTSDLKMEGYKVIAGKDHLALIGRDATVPFYPRGYDSAAQREKVMQEWQEFAGEKWDFPLQALYDPRSYSPELGFSLHDPTGTLFAVYDFLESLGVRWYMPYHDFGTIIPKQSDIVVAEQAVSRNPEFARRFLRFTFPRADTANFIWFKRQKLGMSELAWICHGTPQVTNFASPETHPDYFAVVGGQPVIKGKRTDKALPRLASPLSEAMARYAGKFFDRYPEMRYASVGPADAFTSIDDRDVAAGWLQEERGPNGRLSEYVWRYINETARRIEKTHPDRIAMGLAYSYYRQPPRTIEKLNGNVGVTYCQSRIYMTSPELLQAAAAEREEWLSKTPSGEFFLWEYYLHHRPGVQIWGVPVIFLKAIHQDTLALRGKSKGEYVEAWGHGRQLWGINHLNYYVQAKCYWQPDLDLDALVNEYLTHFYGPAREEMREFFTFAEEVWSRPDSRLITLTSGFLKEADIARFFDILARARAKAGESVYGQRIDLILSECEPMKEIFPKLKRTGPDFEALRAAERPVIDGDLRDALWTTPEGAFRAPAYRTRHLYTGEEAVPATTVMMRWADDNSGLYVAVACDEPQMDRVRPQVTIRDSFSLYDEDFVEIFLETPERSAFRVAINPNGAITDACTDIAVQPSGAAWNADWPLAVKREADRWTIELFIPRASLDNAGIPDNARPWGLNVCRSRFATGKAENSALSPTGGRFFNTTKFGNLIIR